MSEQSVKITLTKRTQVPLLKVCMTNLFETRRTWRTWRSWRRQKWNISWFLEEEQSASNHLSGIQGSCLEANPNDKFYQKLDFMQLWTWKGNTLLVWLLKLSSCATFLEMFFSSLVCPSLKLANLTHSCNSKARIEGKSHLKVCVREISWHFYLVVLTLERKLCKNNKCQMMDRQTAALKVSCKFQMLKTNL